MNLVLPIYIWPIYRLLRGGLAQVDPHAQLLQSESGVTIWSKSRFVVDFRNLLFGCDFDLSFSKGYSLMKISNYEADFTAKCDT